MGVTACVDVGAVLEVSARESERAEKEFVRKLHRFLTSPLEVDEVRLVGVHLYLEFTLLAVERVVAKVHRTTKLERIAEAKVNK